MTITTDRLAALEFTKGDRMKRAMKTAGLSVFDLAVFLDVRRETISTWINDKVTPSKQTMRLWAQATEVPLEWLETGELESRLRESNSRPSHYKVLTCADLGLAA